METPYFFDFESHEILSGGPVEVLPEWCSYSMAFAQEQHYYCLETMEFVLQRYNYAPFHLDLMQAKIQGESMPLSLTITDRQLILYSMLEGEFLITSSDGKPIVVTRSNTMLMGYADVGNYLFCAEKGMHAALVVVILPEWLESTCAGFHVIEDILYHFKHDDKPYNTLHHVKMERKVQRLLQSIYGFSQQNVGAIDGNLRGNISRLLPMRRQW